MADEQNSNDETVVLLSTGSDSMGHSRTGAAVSPPPAEDRAARSPGRDPLEYYREGLCFLAGAGAAKNEGMAIARFLDASDLGHADAAFKAALMYFCGIGITRNEAEAKALARRCLELGPSSQWVASSCNELVAGSLGTANARKFLEQDEDGMLRVGEDMARRGRLKLVLIAVGALLILAAGIALFLHHQEDEHLEIPPAAGIAAVIPASAADQARKDALVAIARLRSDAAGVSQGGDEARTTQGNDF